MTGDFLQIICADDMPPAGVRKSATVPMLSNNHNVYVVREYPWPKRK